ncbi:MAG: carboxymuconolactone decarboxylase family protein [Halobacteriales archaeon]
MALLDYADPDTASDEVAAALAEHDSDRGSLLRPMLARHPPLLAAQMTYHDRLMLEGNLDRALKELVGVVVSQRNTCDYCASSHREKLHALGLSADALAAVEDGSFEALDERERAVARFAEQVATDAHRVGESDLEALRAVGLDDQDVLEVLGVAAMFMAANTLANALSIHPADRDVGLAPYADPSSLDS